MLYDINIVDGNIIGELARRSLQKYNNTVRLLRYKNHICYVSNINAVFQAVMKKANQFILFRFGDIQLLDIMNFLGGASLNPFLKAYKTSETKRFFPYEWFDHPDKMQNTELPPYDTFYSKLLSCNPLEAEYTDYVHLFKSGLTTEQAVVYDMHDVTKPISQYYTTISPSTIRGLAD